MSITFNPAALLNGQGMNVTNVVNELLNQKSGQLTLWQNEQADLQTQASLLTLINSHLESLASAVTALSDPLGVLAGQSGSSSNPGILTATPQSTAASGTHTIVVSSLASVGTLYTNAVSGGASASILPQGATSGALQLQIGGATGTTATIQITAGTNDTLATLSDSINQQSVQNNWGITAGVVTDATGSRLTITSTATGTVGAVAVAGNTTALSFNAPLGGTNASLTVDGIPYSSSTNTVSGAISGVTLNLLSASAGTPVQVTIGPDTQSITQAITDFVSAYNQVVQDMNQQFTVDPTTNAQGPLGSDSGLRGLETNLMHDVTYSTAGNGGLVNLAALGINMNNDGTLTIGTTPGGQTMSQVFAANPQGFLSFFQNSSSTGFANAFHADLTNLTDPTVGLLTVGISQNKTEQQNLSDSINNFATQLAAQQKSLSAQFNRVNAALQSYPLLLQQVTDTLATMSSSNSSK